MIAQSPGSACTLGMEKYTGPTVVVALGVQQADKVLTLVA